MRLVALLVVAVLCGPVQDSEDDFPEKPGPVSATVNGWLISQDRVERFVTRKLAGRPVAETVMRRLRAEALEQLVRRQVILEYLKTTRYWPRGGGAIEMRIGQLQKRLAQVNKDLQQHLQENGMSRAELENEIAWEIAWQQFLQAWLSEERLDQYYQQRQREFDGTRLKVAHLLLRANRGESSTEVIGRAEAVRDQIRLGQSTWPGAVSEYSLAESSISQDGLVGWIGFDGPMPPEFSRAAFQLDPGQISPAVETTAGVHLIKCLEIEPGSAGRRDVEPALRAAMTGEIFDQLAQQKRQDVDVQYDPPGD